MSAPAISSHHAATPEQVASLVFAEHVGKLLYGAGDSGSPLSTAQLVPLTFIHDNPGCTIKALSAGTRVNHSAASSPNCAAAFSAIMALTWAFDPVRFAMTAAFASCNLSHESCGIRIKTDRPSGPFVTYPWGDTAMPAIV